MGNDKYDKLSDYCKTNFNPRSRVGNDIISGDVSHTDDISIHVPAWGTTEQETMFRDLFGFQSTFPRGERHIPNGIVLCEDKFQSTFPRGERPCIISVNEM